MDTVCCVCHRIKQDGEWVEGASRNHRTVSHGYCPDCASVARVELVLLQLKRFLPDAEGARASA